LWAALAPEVEGVTGEYFADCKVTPASANANNVEHQHKLWDLSVKLTGLETDPTDKQ
jgi:retinol dehydrogenase-13